MDTLHISNNLTSSQSIVSRLAPTPSGYLHLGNAFSFILTWLLVRRLGGKLHLRIDDLDAPRLNQDCLEDIFIQLEWLGLDYDTGPQGPDDHLRRFSQSLKLEEY
ncbi:MAG: glutamate--tRNA ligase family protein, partial [bacterium]